LLLSNKRQFYFICYLIFNRKRSRSLKAEHGQSASWGEISPDVWAQSVPEQAGALEVPVIDLLALGVDADEFGELVSLDPGLERLDSGKEAVAWLHRSTGCLYKLFDLGPEGDLGQRLDFERRTACQQTDT
jgi:hypothetical protein